LQEAVYFSFGGDQQRPMNHKARWILGVIGSLIVGALGSGLWSEVFAPVGSRVARGLMWLLTLGMSSARDSIYERAGGGFSERPSVILLSILGMTIFYFPLVLLVSRYLLPGFVRRSRDTASDDLARKLARLRRITFYLTLAMCFLGAIVFVQTLFVGYTNTVVTRFNQQLAVATPYLTPDQRNVLLARFALIKSRQDFVALLDELNEVARSHGQPASSFSPW
jgi:hypothetical protein